MGEMEHGISGGRKHSFRLSLPSMQVRKAKLLSPNLTLLCLILLSSLLTSSIRTGKRKIFEIQEQRTPSPACSNFVKNRPHVNRRGAFLSGKISYPSSYVYYSSYVLDPLLTVCQDRVGACASFHLGLLCSLCSRLYRSLHKMWKNSSPLSLFQTCKGPLPDPSHLTQSAFRSFSFYDIVPMCRERIGRQSSVVSCKSCSMHTCVAGLNL